MKEVLTKTQARIMEYLREFIKENSYPPTVRELCLGLDIKSTSTIHANLKSLAEKGYIKYTQSTRRSIVIIDDDSKEQTVSVPLLGNVAAGIPILATENINEYYQLPTSLLRGSKGHDIFMLSVQGNSMIDIGMYENDMIIVMETASVSNGDIAVVRVNEDTVTVKRFYHERDRIRLQPENSHMDPIYAPLESVEVVGKVIGLFRSI